MSDGIAFFRSSNNVILTCEKCSIHFLKFGMSKWNMISRLGLGKACENSDGVM